MIKKTKVGGRREYLGPKNSKKLLVTINTFSKVARYKINIQKLVAFLYINNEQTEKEIRKIIPFIIASKRNPRNKFNKGSDRPLQ
jgi:hypothetical protein